MSQIVALIIFTIFIVVTTFLYVFFQTKRLAHGLNLRLIDASRADRKLIRKCFNKGLLPPDPRLKAVAKRYAADRLTYLNRSAKSVRISQRIATVGAVLLVVGIVLELFNNNRPYHSLWQLGFIFYIFYFLNRERARTRRNAEAIAEL